MKHRFICFTGIDGAGKTTQAKLLAKTLNEKGIKSKYVYNRYIPILWKPFMILAQKIFLKGKDKFKDYKGYSNTKRRIFKNKLFHLAYQYIILGDYFFQILFKIKIPLRYTNIVCDRYIYDTVITDLSVDLNYSKKEIKNLINNLFKIFPKPDIVFLIDINEEIAFKRKTDVPALEYLKERREIYSWLGREYKMIILSGENDIKELNNKILETTNKLIENRID